MGECQSHVDSGVAGDVVLEGIFPSVKLERKTTPKKLAAANGEQNRDLGEMAVPSTTNQGIHRCGTLRRGNVVKPLISMQKVVRAGNIAVLDARNPHVTLDMWTSFVKTAPIFSGQGQWGGQTAVDNLVRLVALCRGGEAEIRQFEEIASTELKEVEEGADRMSEVAGDKSWR